MNSFQIAKCQEAKRVAALITIQGGVHLELGSNLSLHAAAWLLPTVQRSSRWHCGQLCVFAIAPRLARLLSWCIACSAIPLYFLGRGTVSSSWMASPRHGHSVKFTIHIAPGEQGKIWAQCLQASKGRGRARGRGGGLGASAVMSLLWTADRRKGESILCSAAQYKTPRTWLAQVAITPPTVSHPTQQNYSWPPSVAHRPTNITNWSLIYRGGAVPASFYDQPKINQSGQ